MTDSPQRIPPSDRFSDAERRIDLAAASSDLRAEATEARSGHRQISLAHEDGLSVILFDFEAGGRLADHQAKGLVMIQAIAGRLEVRTASTTHDLPAGALLLLEPGVVHDVIASVPSQMLLTVHLRHR